MMYAKGLGIFPVWQYSMNPAVNPKINATVKYPAGVVQTTIQPLGPYFKNTLQGRSGKLLGFGDIGSTVSSIGTFIILGLAAFGGWNVYKRIRK